MGKYRATRTPRNKVQDATFSTVHRVNALNAPVSDVATSTTLRELVRTAMDYALRLERALLRVVQELGSGTTKDAAALMVQVTQGLEWYVDALDAVARWHPARCDSLRQVVTGLAETFAQMASAWEFGDLSMVSDLILRGAIAGVEVGRRELARAGGLPD